MFSIIISFNDHLILSGPLHVYTQLRDLSYHQLWGFHGRTEGWEEQSLTLRPLQEFRLVFVVRRGYHRYTAVGLDDVTLTSGKCQVQCMYAGKT